jgi:hypothetical protein
MEPSQEPSFQVLEKSTFNAKVFRALCGFM